MTKARPIRKLSETLRSNIPHSTIRTKLFHPQALGATATMIYGDKEDPSLPLYTRILPVNPSEIGTISFTKPNSFLQPWNLTPSDSISAFNLLTAADALRTTLHPIAFPTETVYGLGANALSRPAVQAIFAAKNRPADNPLIVHIASLDQLRSLLSTYPPNSSASSASDPDPESDPIPSVYHSLISRFWPGPLSILLPLPPNSRLAPEVTAGQPTFAARMPSSRLALALIKLSGLPLAAPSANASGRPSPTTAAHVAHDLEGRIEVILDGGPCEVGLESTVVDGLSTPPVVLRPGGVGIEEIRGVEGWEETVVGYRDGKAGERENGSGDGKDGQKANENGDGEEAPRAPGMKYRHYSPAARVVLAKAETGWDSVMARIGDAVGGGERKVGVVRTKNWQPVEGEKVRDGVYEVNGFKLEIPAEFGDLDAVQPHGMKHVKAQMDGNEYEVWDLCIGPSVGDVARGLFSALRELDLQGVDVIFVEGIVDEGEVAAAVMNRLRKAAGETIGKSS